MTLANILMRLQHQKKKREIKIGHLWIVRIGFRIFVRRTNRTHLRRDLDFFSFCPVYSIYSYTVIHMRNLITAMPWPVISNIYKFSTHHTYYEYMYVIIIRKHTNQVYTTTMKTGFPLVSTTNPAQRTNRNIPIFIFVVVVIHSCHLQFSKSESSVKFYTFKMAL